MRFPQWTSRAGGDSEDTYPTTSAATGSMPILASHHKKWIDSTARAHTEVAHQMAPFEVEEVVV